MIPWRSAQLTASAFYVLELAGIALVYLALAKLGLKLALINPSASPVWPATGFALAMVLLRGLRVWPAVFIAALIANAMTAGSLLTSAAIAFGNTLEALTGGYLINRFCGGSRAFEAPINIVKFALISIGPPTLISATIGVSALQAGGFVDPGGYAPVWTTWWMGDFISALLLTPAIILWAAPGPGSFDWKELTNTALLIAAVFLMGLAMFTPLTGWALGKAPRGFLATIPLLWAGLRRGPRDTATVALVLASLALWGEAGVKQTARAGLNEAFILESLFIIGAALPCLVLSADVTMRRRAEASLRESEEQLRLSNEAASIGTFIIDIQAGLVFYPEKTAAILGIPNAGKSSIEAALARVHPEDSARVQAQYESALSGAGDGEFKIDFRYVRPDGEVSWIAWTGRVDFRQEPSGPKPFRVAGAFVDITDRKRDEEKIRLLMDEVNHRSKNLLAVVLSIARQTAGADPREFLERLGQRIESLSASQDLIVKSGWKAVSLDALARAQLAPFPGFEQGQIAITGPQLHISPSAAQTIGMALHELATNASKYGALSAVGGRVAIDWSLGEGEERGAQLFSMSWIEEGGPPAAEPPRRGFGTLVIDDVPRHDLNADIALEFLPAGLRWRLTCPAKEVLETDGT
jgi:PAS domain S-box-containing protein